MTEREELKLPKLQREALELLASSDDGCIAPDAFSNLSKQLRLLEGHGFARRSWAKHKVWFHITVAGLRHRRMEREG